MELRLEFVWNDETGETEITEASAESIQHHFEESAPIHVLDFLRDVLFMSVYEYESALEAFNQRGGNIN